MDSKQLNPPADFCVRVVNSYRTFERFVEASKKLGLPLYETWNGTGSYYGTISEYPRCRPNYWGRVYSIEEFEALAEERLNGNFEIWF